MVNVYNISTISELAKWCLDQSERISWVKHVNFLTEPAWQSAYILTQEQKKILSDKLTSEIKFIESTYKASEKRAIIVAWLLSTIQLLPSHDWSHLREEFSKYNQKLDELRGGMLADFADPLTLSFLS